MKTSAPRSVVVSSVLIVALTLLGSGCASKKPAAKADNGTALTSTNFPPKKHEIHSLVVAQPDVKYFRVSYRGKELRLTNESEQAQAQLPGLLLARLDHLGFQARLATPDESDYIKTNLSTVALSNATWYTKTFAPAPAPMESSNVDAVLLVQLVGQKNTGARAARLGFLMPFTVVGFAAGIGALGYAEANSSGGGVADDDGIMGIGLLGTAVVAAPAWLATGGGKVTDHNLFFSPSQQLRITLIDWQRGTMMWTWTEQSKLDVTNLDKMVESVCSTIPKNNMLSEYSVTFGSR